MTSLKHGLQIWLQFWMKTEHRNADVPKVYGGMRSGSFRQKCAEYVGRVKVLVGYGSVRGSGFGL